MSQQKDEAKITNGRGTSGDEQPVLTTRQGHRDQSTGALDPAGLAQEVRSLANNAYRVLKRPGAEAVEVRALSRRIAHLQDQIRGYPFVDLACWLANVRGDFISRFPTIFLDPIDAKALFSRKILIRANRRSMAGDGLRRQGHPPTRSGPDPGEAYRWACLHSRS
jgi:hypothetical protein